MHTKKLMFTKIVLQNTFFCVPQKKVTQGLDKTEAELNDDIIFWMNYPL